MPPPEVVEPPVVEAPKTGVGPTPSRSKFGDKFRAEFAKLESQNREQPIKPVEPAAEPVEPPKEEPKVAEPPKEPPKEAPPTAPPADVKPESPLDAVVAKGKEPEKPAEEPDVLKEFDEAKPDWKRARGVMKDQSTKIKELEFKLTAPKAAPDEVAALTKKTEELQAELTERENRIKAINAEYSTEYQTMIQDRTSQLGKISSRMKAFGGDGEALAEAVALPLGKVRTAQIKEAMTDVDPDDRARLHTLIENYESHEDKIADFRKDLPKKFDEIQAVHENQVREHQAKMVKQLEAEFVKISEQLPESIVTMREVPDDVPGGTEWNREIVEARTNALRVLKPDGADFNESVSIALKGARYDTLEKRYLELHKDHTELKKQMAEYDSSGPDFKGGGKPTVKVDKKPSEKFREALAARQRSAPDEL